MHVYAWCSASISGVLRWLDFFADFNSRKGNLVNYIIGGREYCCAAGPSSRRGDFVERWSASSFHDFPSTKFDCQQLVLRVNHKGLPGKKVTKNTVVCSLHFHEKRWTRWQPHHVMFKHGTFCLCRKRPMERRRLQSSPCNKMLAFFLSIICSCRTRVLFA